MWLSPMTMSAFVNEYRTIVDVFCIDLSKILALSSVIFISRVLRSAWLDKDQIWGSEGDLQVIIYLGACGRWITKGICTGTCRLKHLYQ